MWSLQSVDEDNHYLHRLVLYHLRQPVEDDKDRIVTVAFPIRRYRQSLSTPTRIVSSSSAGRRQQGLSRNYGLSNP